VKAVEKITDINEKKRRTKEDFYCKEIEDIIYDIGKITGKLNNFGWGEMRNLTKEKARQFKREIKEIKGDLTHFQKKLP
jgi:hypothetical protein